MRYDYFDFFKLKNDFKFVCSCLIVTGILQAIMLLQRILGRCFFLPKSLIPGYYDYYKDILTLEHPDEKCPICLNELRKGGEDGDTDDDTQK